MSRASGFNATAPTSLGSSGDASEQGPTPDSYKFPLVLLSLDSADALDLTRAATPTGVYSNFNGRGANVLELFGSPAQLNADDDQEFRLPAWENIESFEFGFEQESAWVARFTVFDPTFETVLPRLIVARMAASRILAYFKFGWIVDGALREGNMSRAKSGLIVNVVPEVLQDGMRIVFDVQAPETFVKTMEKASACWPSGTAAHVIAKQALEMSHPTVSQLNRRIPSPLVRTPVPTQPVVNSGNAITMTDMSPVAFVREVLLPMTVAADVALQDRKFGLFQSDREPGVLVFAPEGWKDESQGIPIKRTYNVGRGQGGQVRSFKPCDFANVANQLGGCGVINGVDSAAKTASSVSTGPVTANPADNKPLVIGNNGVRQVESTASREVSSANAADSTRFTRFSFARDLDSAVQERKALWSRAQALATQSDAEVLGDPHLHINDYVEFRVYAGGTLSTAGRRDAAQAPTLLQLISGQYVIVGYNHQISGGDFTTALKLVRATQQEMTPEPGDPAYTSDTVGANQNLAPGTPDIRRGGEAFA